MAWHICNSKNPRKAQKNLVKIPSQNDLKFYLNQFLKSLANPKLKTQIKKTLSLSSSPVNGI
jgi:hypothetical protein